MDDLFDEELIAELTSDPRRIVERRRPLDDIMAALGEPDCRIVLLTGGAGAGKTGVLAALAREHPDWPRYFIRRAADRETAYQHEGGLASFLTTVGLQLAALRRDLFTTEQEVAAEVQVDVIQPGTGLTGIAVPRVIISPFTDLNLVFRLRAKRASGEITTVTVGEIVEAAYADPHALEKPALLDPALSLAREHPGDLIVILLDGIDELRLRDASANVLAWLTDHAMFPDNVRFVIASRPDERLGPLSSNDRADVRRVTLEDHGDAAGASRNSSPTARRSTPLSPAETSRETPSSATRPAGRMETSVTWPFCAA